MGRGHRRSWAFAAIRRYQLLAALFTLSVATRNRAKEIHEGANFTSSWFEEPTKSPRSVRIKAVDGLHSSGGECVDRNVALAPVRKFPQSTPRYNVLFRFPVSKSFIDRYSVLNFGRADTSVCSFLVEHGNQS